MALGRLGAREQSRCKRQAGLAGDDAGDQLGLIEAALAAAAAVQRHRDDDVCRERRLLLGEGAQDHVTQPTTEMWVRF